MPSPETLITAAGEREDIHKSDLEGYGIACQILLTFSRSPTQQLNDWLRPRVDDAVGALNRIFKFNLSAQDLQAPERTLKLIRDHRLTQLVVTQQKRTTEAHITNAPVVLRFLARLARQQDLGAFANAKGRGASNAPSPVQQLALEALAKPIALPKPDTERAALVICWALPDKGQYRPVCALFLKPQAIMLETPQARSEGNSDQSMPRADHADVALRPEEPLQIVIDEGAFYDESGELRGGLEPEALHKWTALEGIDTAGLSILQILNDATKQLLEHMPQDGRERRRFAELADFLGNRPGASFVARLVDERDARPSQFSGVLTRALNEPTWAPLLMHAAQRTASGEANATASPGEPLLLATLKLDEFLGHMDTVKDGRRMPAMPLDATQRLAAVAVSRLPWRRAAQTDHPPATPVPALLAVNGPPGTGKTSFLRAALASMWVKAALDRRSTPYVVYGTGATNKAVTNMIEAFGSIRGGAAVCPDHPPGFSWVDGLSSYGWFFPSSDAANATPQLMHLVSGNRSLVPSGSASALADVSEPANVMRLDMFLGRAAAHLNLQRHGLQLEQVLDAVHERLMALSQELRNRQQTAREALVVLRKPTVTASEVCAALALAATAEAQAATAEAMAQGLHAKVATRHDAIPAIESYLAIHVPMSRGWKSLLPARLRQLIWPRHLLELEGLEQIARKKTKLLDRSWPNDLAERAALLAEIKTDLQTTTASANDATELANKHRDSAKKHRDSANALSGSRKTGRSERRLALAKALQVIGPGETLERTRSLSPGEDPTFSDRELLGLRRRARLLLRLLRSSPTETSEAIVHELEVPLDTRLRTAMFHWAARYWEGRWLQECAKKPDASREQAIHRAMMLGVVIVATTHKLVALGQACRADLLVMDEAGQCTSEVAAACLAAAHTAAFVGDVQQLQPIVTISDAAVQAIAKAEAPNQALPAAVLPATGSAMAMARAVGDFTWKCTPGVTLLYHYRCVSDIIGYCNTLMYAGAIVPSRREGAAPGTAWLPAMSWVDVAGNPTRSGGSWCNMQQADAICDWIARHANRLTQGGQLALADVVAVITPLAAQARKLHELLNQRLGPQAAKGITVGTVHKLQGAERPVVLFSLVQDTTNGARLMADRDGGHLMNVAVSRARDAFVIFADGNTLFGKEGHRSSRANTPTGVKPIGALGEYLKLVGTRLFPRTLVVVEAPGKERRISEALGPEVAVMATGGNLRELRLTGELTAGWVDTPGAAALAEKLRPHAAAKGLQLVDRVVIATDDDLAGELIGLHATQQALSATGPNVVVQRMRFSSLEPDHLIQALKAAAAGFDRNLLAAALVREWAKLMDRRAYPEAMARTGADGVTSDTHYFGAGARDLLDWCADGWAKRGSANPEMVGQPPFIATSPTSEPEPALAPDEPPYEIHLRLQSAAGQLLDAFVAADSGALAKPWRGSHAQAQQIASGLAPYASEFFPPFDDPPAGLGPPDLVRSTAQVPGLYPANTTARVLALAMDELNLAPSDAQARLNALYMEGANATR